MSSPNFVSHSNPNMTPPHPDKINNVLFPQLNSKFSGIIQRGRLLKKVKLGRSAIIFFQEILQVHDFQSNVSTSNFPPTNISPFNFIEYNRLFSTALIPKSTFSSSALRSTAFKLAI
jgi:hypothetical protein